MSKTRAPEITSLDPVQLQKLLVQLQQHLPAGLYESVAALLGTLQWLMGVIEKKKATVGRLQRLIFGAKTEKTRNVFPGKGVPAPAAARKRRVRGHGRNGASQYAGAGRVQVPHPSLRPGDCCPECRSDKARLRERPPSRIVRILAQPMVQATIFALQVLRCCLCGKTFTAPAPPEAGTTKYDPNVGLMIGILRFGGGMPHYRLEKLQKDLGIPLPAATQWELMEQSARDLQPAHQELIRLAAQAQIFHNDDTKMRIQSLKQERAQAGSERTGIFTTSILCQVEDRSIALYFTGGKHAGENLTELLQHRAAGLDKPIHMCDGLSRNLPKDFEALLANCLPHGRRGFVDVKDYFPQQCQKVLEDLALVFQHDAQAKEQRLSATDRLRLHQEKSTLIMDGLKQWMEEQLEQKLVEPNSSLGEAINYMLKRWEPLTLFLREPGAPLSNNICEQALKAAILHRKNSLGYKTQNGARVGDLFMSLIHTCRLAAANPFAYFRALHDHAKAVLKDPGAWLPWNFSQSIEALDSG